MLPLSTLAKHYHISVVFILFFILVFIVIFIFVIKICT